MNITGQRCRDAAEGTERGFGLGERLPADGTHGGKEERPHIGEEVTEDRHLPRL